PFAVSGPEGPSQKIECVFSASPETIRREPREFDLRRSVGKWQDLAVCALCNPVVFRRRRFLRRCVPVSFCRHEVSLSPIHREQIRDHLSSYGKRCSIAIPFLLRGFINQGQIVVLPG